MIIHPIQILFQRVAIYVLENEIVISLMNTKNKPAFTNLINTYQRQKIVIELFKIVK